MKGNAQELCFPKASLALQKPIQGASEEFRSVDLPLHVLGYDLRRMTDDVNVFPMSVDERALPSIIDLPHAPEDQGFQYLWADFNLLINHARVSAPPEYGIYLAVVRLNPIDSPNDPGWIEYEVRRRPPSSLHEVLPRFVDDAWKFAGYDVADFYLWSSLHTPEIDLGLIEPIQLLGPRLTSNQALTSFEQSIAICKNADQAYPSRAPFYPYALFSRGREEIEL